MVDQAKNKAIDEKSSNMLCKPQKLKIRNQNKIVIGNVNINSLPNRFEQLKDIIIRYIDILILTETKHDDTFPTASFLVNGFSELYIFDRYRNGTRIMIYIMEDPFLELSYRKCKSLLFRT